MLLFTLAQQALLMIAMIVTSCMAAAAPQGDNAPQQQGYGGQKRSSSSSISSRSDSTIDQAPPGQPQASSTSADNATTTVIVVGDNWAGGSQKYDINHRNFAHDYAVPIFVASLILVVVVFIVLEHCWYRPRKRRKLLAAQLNAHEHQEYIQYQRFGGSGQDGVG